MLHGKSVPQKFWAEAVNTTCYVINRVYLRLGTTQTPYELWKGRKPNVKYFRTFGSKRFIFEDNKRNSTVMEFVNVAIDDCSIVNDNYC